MDSIFFYPGGKNKRKIKEWILSFKPSDVYEYREPFVGGGGVFFAMDKVPVRWINDMDEKLISVYLALRDRPEDFIIKCKAIEPHTEGEEQVPVKATSKILCNKRLKELFYDFVNNDSVDPALRFYFINRLNWNGRVRFEQPSSMYPSVQIGWNLVKKGRLELAAEHIKGVKITNDSYERLLLEPSNGLCWIYCDPPYMVNTFISQNRKLYTHSFAYDDHAKFFDIVRKSPHKVCVSYDDHPDIKKLAESHDLNIFSKDWFYTGTNLQEDQKVVAKKQQKELVITNYN